MKPRAPASWTSAVVALGDPWRVRECRQLRDAPRGTGGATLPLPSPGLGAEHEAMRRRGAMLLWSLWLGMGVGVAFVAIPAVFATARPGLPPGEPGSTAQAVLWRYFIVQSVLALLLAIVEGPAWMGRASGSRWRPATFGLLLASCLASLLWLHPTLSGLHRVRHDPATVAAERESAAVRFRRLHGASQGLNLATLFLVLAHWSAAGRAAGGLRERPASQAAGAGV